MAGGQGRFPKQLAFAVPAHIQKKVLAISLNLKKVLIKEAFEGKAYHLQVGPTKSFDHPVFGELDVTVSRIPEM